MCISFFHRIFTSQNECENESKIINIERDKVHANEARACVVMIEKRSAERARERETRQRESLTR